MSVAVFFIDTDTGQVATQRQLVEAGVAAEDGQAPRPWHRIQGTSDATTLWYAVMRRQERGIFIGNLVSGNSVGILIDGGNSNSNQVLSNWIGTDATGSVEEVHELKINRSIEYASVVVPTVEREFAPIRS